MSFPAASNCAIKLNEAPSGGLQCLMTMIVPTTRNRQKVGSVILPVLSKRIERLRPLHNDCEHRGCGTTAESRYKGMVRCRKSCAFIEISNYRIAFDWQIAVPTLKQPSTD